MAKWRKFDFAGWLAVVAILNLMSWILIGEILGCHAHLGGVSDQDYFLGRGGELTSVSEQTYRYSQVHFVLMILLIVIAMIATWGSKRQRAKR